MKGLLLKDLYLLKKYCGMFFVVIFFFAGVSIFSDGNVFFLYYPCIFAGMLPMTLLSYDEMEKWDSYAETLPVSRAQMVSAKYTIGLLGNVFVVCLLLIAQFLAGVSMLEDLLIGGLMLLSLGLLAPGILLPFVYKFGAQKGRIVYYIVIALLCVAGSGFFSMHENGVNFAALGEGGILLICLGGIAVYVLSWLMSVRFYQRRAL